MKELNYCSNISPNTMKMPCSISLQLAENPSKLVLAFSPRGGKIRVTVKFSRDNIPERYHMQITDSLNNTRLNRYGKGSEDKISLDWLIPTIRAAHHGVWHVNVNADTESFNEHFFVYPFEVSQLPLLPAASDILDEKVIQPSSLDTAVQEEAPSVPAALQSPVIMIKGIGQTFANRLAKYDIFSVEEFVNYPDRTYLGEIMRISESRLVKLIKGGESLLSKEQISFKDIKDSEIVKTAAVAEFVDGIAEEELKNLVDIPGIGSKTAKRLIQHDIRTISDFVNHPDRIYLGQIVRASDRRLTKMLAEAAALLETQKDHGIQMEDVKAKEIHPVPEGTDNAVIDLLDIPGIGQKTLRKLIELGINNVEDLLLYCDRNGLRKTLRMSEKRFNNLITSLGNTGEYVAIPIFKAVRRVRKEEKINSLTDIKGIGLKTAKKLKAAGIRSAGDLIKADSADLSRKTKITVKRLETWKKYIYNHKLSIDR